MQPLLARLAELRRPTVLVTHKAVGRAIYALAERMDHDRQATDQAAPQLRAAVCVGRGRMPAVERLNVSLEGWSCGVALDWRAIPMRPFPLAGEGREGG